MKRECEERENLEQLANERIIGYTMGYVRAMRLFESDRGPSNVVDILQELPGKIRVNINIDFNSFVTMAQYMLIVRAVYDMLVAEENRMKERRCEY